MTKLPTLACLCCLLIINACNSRGNESSSAQSENADSQTVNTTPSSTTKETTINADTDTQDEVLSWVDNLNIRAQPNTKSKVIAQAKENEMLTLTGEKTDFTETISLRGHDYTEPWVEVKTTAGKTGWVFQGAIKRPGEDKGTEWNSKTTFTYPYFGTFDLNSWKKMPARDDSNEELDVATEVYTKDGQMLEIAIVERGEFSYSKTYTLKNTNGKTIKERRLQFIADYDYNILTETVKDYSSKPVKEYTRSQNIKKHFSQLKPKPDMANGEWKISPIAKSGSKSGDDTSQGTLSTFSYGECDKKVMGDAGCSCSYSTGDPYKGPIIFLSNMDEYACVKINDFMNVMRNNKVDMKKEFKKLSQAKYWITLKDGSPVLYFGKPLQEYGYENEIEFLTDVILASGRNINEIPIENKATGMAIREVRDVAADAVAKAKQLKSNDLGDSMDYMSYGDQNYTVVVRTRRMTNYEGEANEYKGTITLFSNDGKSVLDQKAIKGSCGC